MKWERIQYKNEEREQEIWGKALRLAEWALVMYAIKGVSIQEMQMEYSIKIDIWYK